MPRLIPWGVVMALCVSGVLTHRYAYQLGNRRGQLDTMYDEMASRMPGDLRLMIALLRRDGQKLSPDELMIFRNRLNGTLSFAQGMVIPMERERGRADRATELEQLLKQGREVEQELGPMYPKDGQSRKVSSS